MCRPWYVFSRSTIKNSVFSSSRSDAPGKMQFEEQIFSANNINNYRAGKDLLNRLTFQRPILFSKYSSNLAVLASKEKEITS